MNRLSITRLRMGATRLLTGVTCLSTGATCLSTGATRLLTGATRLLTGELELSGGPMSVHCSNRVWEGSNKKDAARRRLLSSSPFPPFLPLFQDYVHFLHRRIRRFHLFSIYSNRPLPASSLQVLPLFPKFIFPHLPSPPTVHHPASTVHRPSSVSPHSPPDKQIHDLPKGRNRFIMPLTLCSVPGPGMGIPKGTP
jgi:hypothetical protein